MLYFSVEHFQYKIFDVVYDFLITVSKVIYSSNFGKRIYSRILLFKHLVVLREPIGTFDIIGAILILGSAMVSEYTSNQSDKKAENKSKFVEQFHNEQKYSGKISPV